ncbi:MAG: ImmA/IrrE family metallo-endopeptidase [Caldilineae bacterium]|nr:MAG: ImmA/IrrE family metallo-endopeptidase [Caldilineae bacterium]
MPIGERIKSARRAAGLSQRALAKAAGISAMAISKYERQLDTPGSDVLLRLAQALKVKTEYFLRPVTITITPPTYRRRASLPKKQEEAITGQVQEWLERYLDVESLFGEPLRFALPAAFNPHITSLEEVEKAALSLRRAWHLGQGPVESLVEVLEERGIRVGQVEGHNDFDTLTLWANDHTPVIVVKRGIPGDRQRFNLAHELGHLVLEPTSDVNAEKAANRFAGAFLVPAPAARRELGSHRQTLHIFELHLLKHKYGLSMQAWIYRAKDLGILSETAAGRLFQQFRRQGWHRQEPGDAIPPEEPERMKRLVLRALAEDLISESRAAELLGTPLPRFWQKESKQHNDFPILVHH